MCRTRNVSAVGAGLLLTGGIVINMNQLCEQVGEAVRNKPESEDERGGSRCGKTIRPYYPAHRYLPPGWKFPSGLLSVYRNWAQRIRIHRVTPGIT